MSKRQQECLQGVADHLDSQQIGDRLGISPHTVDGHVTAAVKSLGARSRRDAVRIAGLVATNGSLTGQFSPVDLAPENTSIDGTPPSVKEIRAAFDHADDPRLSRKEIDRAANQLAHPLRILCWIVGIAAAAAVVLLALEPLAQSAQHLANAIQHYRIYRPGR